MNKKRLMLLGAMVFGFCLSQVTVATATVMIPTPAAPVAPQGVQGVASPMMMSSLGAGVSSTSAAVTPLMSHPAAPVVAPSSGSAGSGSGSSVTDYAISIALVQKRIDEIKEQSNAFNKSIKLLNDAIAKLQAGQNAQQANDALIQSAIRDLQSRSDALAADQQELHTLLMQVLGQLGSLVETAKQGVPVTAQTIQQQAPLASTPASQVFTPKSRKKMKAKAKAKKAKAKAKAKSGKTKKAQRRKSPKARKKSAAKRTQTSTSSAANVTA